MRSRNRRSALRIATCLGVVALAWALPSVAMADHRDGRGSYRESHDRSHHRDGRGGFHDGGRHRGGDHGRSFAAHRHGSGCGHGRAGYDHRPPRYAGYGHAYGRAPRPWGWFFWR